MSEFYLLRRSSIADLTAFFGFLAGFLGSSPIAWPYLSVGFQTGEITRGFLYFVTIICGAGVVGGLAGLGVGSAAGWTWERLHRYARARVATHTDAEPQLVVGDHRGAVGSANALSDPAIRYDASGMEATSFLALLQRVVPGAYEPALTDQALARTMNIGAWDGERLVGAARVLTDGYLFSTVPDLIVDPAYRRRGIGRALMTRALAVAPNGTLVFGAPPQSEGFLSRLGCERGALGFTLRVRTG